MTLLILWTPEKSTFTGILNDSMLAHVRAVPRNQEDLRHRESLISNFKESQVGPGKSQVLKVLSFSIAREGAKYLGEKKRCRNERQNRKCM